MIHIVADRVMTRIVKPIISWAIHIILFSAGRMRPLPITFTTEAFVIIMLDHRIMLGINLRMAIIIVYGANRWGMLHRKQNIVI